MGALESLPVRPSLESLRKQAKKLLREAAAGDAAALARMRVHVPSVNAAFTRRHAQLVIAREYGFDGWQDLVAEVARRVGSGLEWAVAQARRVIHHNDVERLRQLLAEYPALLSWQDGDGGLVGMATGAYGDAGDAEREEWFTRAACAELLIDSGAVVAPSIADGILQSRARGLLELFRRKGLLPRTLPFLAALGETEAVRGPLDTPTCSRAAVADAFVRACSFAREPAASLLLERLLALDPALREKVDGSVGRRAFIEHFIATRPEIARDIGGKTVTIGLWEAFVMQRIAGAVTEDDLAGFVGGLRREPWLLGDDFVHLQNELISSATLNGRESFVTALLELDPAILRRSPPPASQALEFALTYGHARLVPLLERIWPLPDDLPHAAGTGNFARVREWFSEAGSLRDAEKHYPYNDARARSHLKWDPPTAQQVLDVALAFSVTNHHFDVADFLLERGADIDTRWNSHEPASLLHHLVFLKDYEAMRFLIRRGVDMTIEDYRWRSTARGWALHAMNDPEMADWLGEAEREQKRER